MPAPDYQYAVDALVAAYKSAVRDIQAELARLDLTGLSRANSAAALAEVARILASLNEDSAKWVDENIPKAARDGIIRTIIALGAADTFHEAEALVKFNRINSHMVAAAVADTQADLLAVTQNIDRKVRSAVRQAVADSMRANMAKGINGRRTISGDILDRMKKSLGAATDTGIIDAAGRRWKPEVYADMVTRTKMMSTQIEATTNEAVQRDALYGVISRHGATDGCGKWEGRVVKLIAEAPGDYPTVADAKASGEIFHPNCRHVISPIRNPERA